MTSRSRAKERRKVECPLFFPDTDAIRALSGAGLWRRIRDPSVLGSPGNIVNEIAVASV